MISQKSTLRLQMHVSVLKQKSMTIKITSNHRQDLFADLEHGLFEYETSLTFPDQILITLDGKGPNDTVVDDKGNIVEDKFIQLLDINVDGLSCNPHFLHHRIFLTTNSGQTVQSNYWGFNGTVLLDFLQPNSFFWALESVDIH